MPKNLPATNKPPDKKIDPRTNDLIKGLAIGLSVEKAALKAGYSPGYARSKTIYDRIRSPRFIELLDEETEHNVDLAKIRAKARLVRHEQMADKWLDHCEDNGTDGVKDWVKESKPAERDYKITGVLSDQQVSVSLVHVNAAIQVQVAMKEQQTVSNEHETVLIENADTSRNKESK